ncbi:hypothetical protein Pcinc_041991 [Petrolisthes cinctipes]|uniref:Uncharacterized protein n=1 Tax=Petrolisthes cinctipes TaxID=88211 RepID=A0AAE1BIT3_PETCI|nr:hypothetical protein Pcinc_041991 [Petrolisthes cinctipes]
MMMENGVDYDQHLITSGFIGEFSVYSSVSCRSNQMSYGIPMVEMMMMAVVVVLDFGSEDAIGEAVLMLVLLVVEVMVVEVEMSGDGGNSDAVL